MIEKGFCQCGCGQRTKIAPYSKKRDGWIKGQPTNYINHHHKRGSHHSEESKLKISKSKTNSKGTDIERFFNKIKIMPNGCWVWTAYILDTGYGQFKSHGKTTTAHKFIYEYIHGKVPKKMTLDHLCRNRACANPNHLEVVTIRENILRGISFASDNHKKTHCNHGHLLSGENLYMHHGKRYCKICCKQRLRDSRQKAKERLYLNMAVTREII